MKPDSRICGGPVESDVSACRAHPAPCRDSEAARASRSVPAVRAPPAVPPPPRRARRSSQTGAPRTSPSGCAAAFQPAQPRCRGGRPFPPSFSGAVSARALFRVLPSVVDVFVCAGLRRLRRSRRLLRSVLRRRRATAVFLRPGPRLQEPVLVLAVIGVGAGAGGGTGTRFLIAISTICPSFDSTSVLKSAGGSAAQRHAAASRARPFAASRSASACSPRRL